MRGMEKRASRERSLDELVSAERGRTGYGGLYRREDDDVVVSEGASRLPSSSTPWRGSLELDRTWPPASIRTPLRPPACVRPRTLTHNVLPTSATEPSPHPQPAPCVGTCRPVGSQDCLGWHISRSQ
ncbi:hypothetical protein BC628DRAFT_1361569 [Trametes gibbosa]|nr:hypothetical protein BC628DRAFT_1361569 [Trametes gibbosa]